MEKLQNKKDAMKVALGSIAGITAFELATMSCLVFTVCMVISILLIVFIAISKINGDKFTRRGIVTLVVAIITLLCVGCYHRYFCHNVVETPEVVAGTTTEEPTEDTVEEPAEESVEPAEATSSVARPARGYCPEDEKLEETEENSEVPAKAETTVADTISEIKVEDNSKELADTEKAVEEAEKNGDTVKELDNGIIAIEKDQEVVTEKDETQIEIDTDSAEDLVNEGEEPSTEEKVEDVEASDDKTLDDMLEESTTEITEDTTSETTEETTEVVTTPANGNVSIEEVTEVENDSNVIDVEESVELPEVEKVSVEPIDGYDTVVGSQIQFKINGDDVVIDGLDGINYQFNNGILTVDAGDCATVITVTISNTISSTSFDINVNGIVG